MKYIEAKKRYGQNFLKTQSILQKISSSISVLEDDLIIEIGPGMGALTEYLVQKNCYLLCYEIDTRMKEYLDKYDTGKCSIIFDDFLKRDIISDIQKYKCRKLYVVANIPYYITSPIITKLIELNKFSEIVLLVQKEFAERITAEHGHKEYNAFTLFIDAFYDSELLFIVDRTHFIPSPNVDSAVIKLSQKEETMINNQEFYFKFIKDAFGNKRKTLKNNLKNYDWDKIKEILNELGYQESVRAEEISKKDFKILSNKYEEYCN